MKIAIRGTSAAAWCCVHLLKSAGLKPVFQPAGRPGVPAIMLSDAALSLIRDIFGKPSLFMNAPRITRRVVKWGPGANPVALDHSAVVVSERDLMTGLQLDEVDPGQASDVADADFTLFAARPLPPGPVEHCFGSRHASAARIRLKDPRDSSTCWIAIGSGRMAFSDSERDRLRVAAIGRLLAGGGSEREHCHWRATRLGGTGCGRLSVRPAKSSRRLASRTGWLAARLDWRSTRI